MRRSRSALALAAAVALLLGGCGGDGAGPGPYGASPTSSPSSSPASPQVAVPTAEELAAALVTTDAYEGTWTVNVPPDQEAAVSGVVSEAQQEMLPRIEFCEKASEESRAAAEALRWQAFRQLDQSEPDPLDMAAGDRRGHLVFVQEFLMAGEPAEVEATFDALRDGMRACEGAIPAGEEGAGTAEPMSLPAVGEDRFGELTTMEEAGGGAYWLLHNAVVRRGPVLMSLQVVDIVAGDGVQPSFTTEDVGTFVTTAVDRLP